MMSSNLIRDIAYVEALDTARRFRRITYHDLKESHPDYGLLAYELATLSDALLRAEKHMQRHGIDILLTGDEEVKP